MKYIYLLIISCLIAGIAIAQKVIPAPNPPRLVVDNARLLSQAEQDALERKLVMIDDSSSNQIAVLTIPSLNGESIEDVAVNTFREWKIGAAKKNNGVLLIIAVQDRKVRIEVGYGLEGAIPDITANQIIQNDIKPFFANQQFFKGIDAATNSIAKAAIGEYKVAKTHKKDKKGGGSLLFFIILIVIIIILISRRRGGGGGDNGWIAPIILSNLMNSGSRYDNSGWGDNSGYDSGSFDGFGGGDSGGGGASGSW